MGRSRITRTFHNKPKTKRIPTPQTTKHVSGSSSRSEEPQRQTYNTPQAHAQESRSIPVNPQAKYGTIDSTEDQIIGEQWGSFGFTIDKTGKARGNNVKIRKSTRSDGVAKTTVTSKYTNLDAAKYGKEQTPLGLFASGVGNQAHDIGGSVHGLVTGKGYQVKSVLNRSLDHAFAGDWDSAGKVISDNPYRFAGNVATEVGLAVIPFGMMARGAGIAGRVGGAVSKTKKLVGGKGNPNKAKEFAKKEKTLKVLQHENIHMAVTKKASSSPKKSQRSVSNIATAYNRSNEGAKLPNEGLFSGKAGFGGKIQQHNKSLVPDDTYFQKGLPGSVIPSDLVKQGTFYTQRARWNPNRGAVFRVADRQKIGGPKGTGSFSDLRGITSSDNQHMSQFSKYPVPGSAVKAFAKDGKIKRPSDGKTIRSLVWYEGQFTPSNPFVPGV